ncbi:MAG: hypothetical protein RL660_329 [Bacteroidota bacterium]|jgi:hypothetical protein
MKKFQLLSAAAVLTTFFVYAVQPGGQKPAQMQVANAPEPNAPPQKDNVIQIALLLDVSSSMDGLIAQAKSELWSVVSTISAATKQGKAPMIQIAIYDYGKSTHSPANNYVRRVLDFTSDLDVVSQKLFELQTNGGEEYCGAVIANSVNELQWLQDDDQYKTIIVAGNEPFNQGSVDYKQSCLKATQKYIIVNTVHCGDNSTGITTYWQDGAQRGKGKYLSINSNIVAKHYTTPYDATLEQLNAMLNNTYWGYGAQGRVAEKNVQVQDAGNYTENKAGYYQRIAVKSKSRTYQDNTATWDVTSKAVSKDGTVIVSEVEKLKEDELPEQLKRKTVEERKIIIQHNYAQRDSINREIGRLVTLREQHIAEQKRLDNTRDGQQSLGSALVDAIKQQAIAKGYTFE